MLKYLITSDVEVIPVSPEIAEKSGEFKFYYGSSMSLADAVIGATAWKEQAVVVTSDRHFLRIKEIKVRFV